jgi:hypothetical protein
MSETFLQLQFRTPQSGLDTGLGDPQPFSRISYAEQPQVAQYKYASKKRRQKEDTFEDGASKLLPFENLGWIFSRVSNIN